MENESPTTPASAGDRPQTAALKRKGVRTRITRAVAVLNYEAEPKFDLALIAHLQNMPDDEFKALTHRVMVALGAAMRGDPLQVFANCPHCGAPLEAPSPEISVANLMRWQQQRPQHSQWGPFELRKLLEHLQAHPGCVVIPTFALSCDIREPSGAVYTWERAGRVKS